jgi:hypothetical protein
VNTYVILRRSGWATPGDLQDAAAPSKDVGDEEMGDDIRWIRSYVLQAGSGPWARCASTRRAAPR